MPRNYIGYLGDVPQRRVYLDIELRNRGGITELSISGTAGDGSAGQIAMHIEPEDITPSSHLTSVDVARLWSIWNRWHLNCMRAYCEHQGLFARACGVAPHVLWDTANGRRPTWRTTDEYDREKSHQTPVECPICNYSYGSAWLSEELPADVVDFLRTTFAVIERS